MAKLTKDLEKRIVAMRGKQYSPEEIMRITNAPDLATVREVLDRDMTAVVTAFKEVPKSSPKYRDILINAVRLLRTEYNMNYRQIAEALGESEYVIFDVIRRNDVSRGTNGFIRASFTREEKRMRNEDMLRLNQKEGKTLSEIGKIYFVSKQIISRIFKTLEYKPISETEALAVGREDTNINTNVLNLTEEVEQLKKSLSDTKREASIARYHMNGQILDLRIALVTALSKNLELIENPSDDIVNQYNMLLRTLKRTQAALLKTGGEETIELKKISEALNTYGRVK